MNPLPCILTIAGSDSGGGAGIQADLKTISMLGAYGASVITALTAQNTTAVTAIHAPQPVFVAEQMKAVISDFDVRAAKTGMLFSAPIIKALAPFFAAKTFPLVVDPVCVAQSGAKLLEDEAVEAMVELVFPHATLLTPNIPEAELFTGMSIKTTDDMVAAAEKMLGMGPKAVLIKGGHMDSVTATDWLAMPGHKPMPLMQRRVDTQNNHGTGCTLSAAIATGLGQGLDLYAAVRGAQKYLNLALRASFSLGAGSGPPNHLAPWIKEKARGEVVSELEAVGMRFVGMSGFSELVPECRMNVVCGVPFADEPDDVAGFTGGISASRNGVICPVGHPGFGASTRVAAALLAMRKYDEEQRWAVNLNPSEAVIGALRGAGLGVAYVDPDAQWFDEHVEDGISKAIARALAESAAADAAAVLCSGGECRLPMLWLFAADSEELLARICAVIDQLKSAESL
ncbi:bifunctional hydroxymethylpyrimidine kinase/phosphomethylpyrimidine kinase [Salidesulfovibrio brasiliensis]